MELRKTATKQDSGIISGRAAVRFRDEWLALKNANGTKERHRSSSDSKTRERSYVIHFPVTYLSVLRQ